jgi:hypothetical protein
VHIQAIGPPGWAANPGAGMTDRARAAGGHLNSGDEKANIMKHGAHATAASHGSHGLPVAGSPPGQPCIHPQRQSRRLTDDIPPLPAAISCQAYERLLSGETVSWAEILREHPMLGMITVPQLIKAGVVRETFDVADGASVREVRLCRCETGAIAGGPSSSPSRAAIGTTPPSEPNASPTPARRDSST